MVITPNITVNRISELLEYRTASWWDVEVFDP
jgi:hypothetical protein